MTTAKEIECILLSMRDEKQSEVSIRFFKTGKGEYGEGDQFLGIRNPQVRIVVSEAWNDITFPEVAKLISNQWHEVRLCGLLILVKLMERAVKRKDEIRMTQVHDLYLSLHEYVNNWDLVDLSATVISGCWEVMHPDDKLMDEWIKPDKSIWQRRIAMISTWRLVRVGRYDEVFSRAECLILSDENLLHKAAGWMLREVGKSGGMLQLDDFLDEHVSQMPSVMLSYAIEKKDVTERQYWTKRRRGVL